MTPFVIGRIAVSKEYQGLGWRPQIVNFLKHWFINNKKTGCRYITVDTLAEKAEFYEKHGFKVLVTPEDGDETILMYYDLKKFVSTNNG